MPTASNTSGGPSPTPSNSPSPVATMSPSGAPPFSSTSRSHDTPTQKSATTITRWTLDGPLPETNGIAFDVTWNQNVFPRVFQLSDFRQVHFWDHGHRFTFLMPSTQVDVTAPLSLGMPKLVLNRPYAVHTHWVSSVVLHPIGDSLVVTCFLYRPAAHYSLGTSPISFVFAFSR